jgi:hypothetical protein
MVSTILKVVGVLLIVNVVVYLLCAVGQSHSDQQCVLVYVTANIAAVVNWILKSFKYLKSKREEKRRTGTR